MLKPNGEIRKVSPQNGSCFSLKELQGMVEGIIEIFPIYKNVGPIVIIGTNVEKMIMEKTDGYIMVINEEGKIKTPELNHVATRLAECTESILPGDWITGNVLVCPSKMVK